jgi:hypothetical protein
MTALVTSHRLRMPDVRQLLHADQLLPPEQRHQLSHLDVPPASRGLRFAKTSFRLEISTFPYLIVHFQLTGEGSV